jgi:uncharacterized NAD-dependent epimerase/dehydratase family protein
VTYDQPRPTEVLDGPAIVWCDGAFDTPEGKTAHGLVRFTRRYHVLSVIDRRHAGRDAGDVLDDKRADIPVVRDFDAALANAKARDIRPTHLVIGMAPDGGRLPDSGRAVVRQALEAGLNVDCGLHDFLTEDPLNDLAVANGLTIRDIRKPPHRRDLHHFSGRIKEVESLRVAVLGTDSAVGKRTTAWLLVFAMERRGKTAQMIGTGQTGWLQGAKYSMVLDSLVNDFVAGELEHAVVSAWDDEKPDCIVIEGQGSLMNPAYPGGLEILAATRPDAVVLQHAPARRFYDGFPGHALHPLKTQIEALELVSGRPVVAITVNHEDIPRAEVAAVCAEIEAETGLPTVEPLRMGVDRIVDVLLERSGS